MSAITLLLGLIYTLKVVDVIWIMTTGGPGDASTTLAIWSYREAFGTGQPDFSPAAAVGNLLIVIALVFGFLHLRSSAVRRTHDQLRRARGGRPPSASSSPRSCSSPSTGW